MRHNAIDVAPFSPDDFKRRLTGAASEEGSTVARQIDYLARYCERLGAKTIVSEAHYVDRHFLDEFVLYYSRNLSPPVNSVRRFHVFKEVLTDRQLTERMEARARTDGPAAANVDQKLSKAYLGFISIRPVAGAPVGRTILRRLEDGHRRDIWATGQHVVHLGNLELTVDGIAFQQQDEAVGACATAALWTALYRVTRRDGMRAPTPAEVSEAASRHLLMTGRALPAAGGLTIEQLAEAVRQKGLAPEFVSAEARPEVFVAALHAYLRSGIPVVLALRAMNVGGETAEGEQLVSGDWHAVAAVGFQCDGAADPVLEGSVPLSSAYLKKLYVHDDRLGPYARAFVRPTRSRRDLPECLVLEIETRRAWPDDLHRPNAEGLERWLIDGALAPVYPKLRLPVRSLITLAELLADPVERIVGDDAPKLRLDLFYQQGGEYLRKLNGRVASDSGKFFRTVSLPRWCGIVRWSLGTKPLVDFVYDTTDILRSGETATGDPETVFRDAGKLLRAVVSLDEKHRGRFRGFSRAFGVPWT